MNHYFDFEVHVQHSQTINQVYMLWFKFLFGLKFSNQFDFYFLLFPIRIMNMRHWKIKTQLV